MKCKQCKDVSDLAQKYSSVFKKTAVNSECVTQKYYIKLISWVAVYMLVRRFAFFRACYDMQLGNKSSVRTSLYGKIHARRVFLSRLVDAAWKRRAIFTCSPPPVDPARGFFTCSPPENAWTPRVTLESMT